ncbi:MAG: uroporphyrinogen-III synthase [Melioribacteraceae bacterium]|nr:uroporphyrinogen-III synthase [Melioribacteraceae bacterium]
MKSIKPDSVILITKSKEDLIESKTDFYGFENNLIYFPAIKISVIEENPSFFNAINNISDYQVIIFQSGHAVRSFKALIKDIQIDYSNIFIICIGEKTASFCKKFNIPVNHIPVIYSAEGLIEEVELLGLKNSNILIPGSSISERDLVNALSKFNNKVDFIPVYETILNNEVQIENVRKEKPDIFIFTSPSNFRNFNQLLEIKEEENYFDGRLIASLGTTTKKAIEKKGLNVDIVPKTFTVSEVFKVIKEEYCLN